MSTAVLYLPGLGDHRPWFQDKLIWFWRLFGLEAEYHQVGWASDEPFKAKLDRIVKRVDELTKNGDKVALVGVSAGAGMALNVYMARRDKVAAVIFIVGKVYGTSNINPNYFQENPAFKDSLEMSDKNYQDLQDSDKQKMLYIYSNSDRTVGPEFNRMKGVSEKSIFAFSHISAFYLAITLHARQIAKFIKNNR